jgi:hypothetical protein
MTRTQPVALALPVVLRIVLVTTVIAAFFTGTRFFGGIANNFGAFEVAGCCLLFAFCGYVLAQRSTIRFHPVAIAAIVMDCICAISIAWLPDTSVPLGVIQVLILIFLTAVLIVVHNLLIFRATNLPAFLRIVTIAAVAVGIWLAIAGSQDTEGVIAAGPFRNRAHMGLHLLTIFWLVMLFLTWAGRRARERLLAIGAVPLLLYSIAGAGRRSVYLSLFVGLGLLGAGVLLARTRRRAPILLACGTVAAFLYWYYEVAPEFSQRARFFRERVGLVGSRLDVATASRDEVGPNEDNFLLAQREGVLLAFSDHPFLGIGWAGFLDSSYNMTRHEVHSTPLRFLAETGIVGFSVYGAFVGLLVFTALRTAHRARGTPHALVALVAAVSVLGLLLSWAYNRHIHERTFWLYAAVILALETYVDRWRAAQASQVKASLAQGSVVGLSPGAGATVRPAGSVGG